MSQHGNQDPERVDIIGDDRLNQPSLPRIPSQPSQAETHFGDSSGPLFTIYSKIAEEEDNKMTERWQKDAEGMIIFNGLFSAVVAALVSISVTDLRPNSQDTSNFYLQGMYQLQADPNVSRSSTVAQPPAFSPPTYAVWVNSLWFLSLVISLSCAMLATSVQQWTRRYLKVTQPARCSPHKRARMRAFYADGVDKFHVGWAVEALPALVHLSLFIFFAGLAIYLFNVHHTVFYTVIGWVALLSTAYGCITLMPSFWHDSPYYSPLSSTAHLLCSGILWTVYVLLSKTITLFSAETAGRYKNFAFIFVMWFSDGVEREAEEVASEGSPEINRRVLEWTADALGEDDTSEKFCEAIPGFYKSDVVKDPRRCFSGRVQSKILRRLNGFIRNTLSSNSVSEAVKIRRLTMCLNAAREVYPRFGVGHLFDGSICGNWYGAPHAVEIGHFLRSWGKSFNNGQFAQRTQVIAAHIVANVQERNDRWIALARDHLGVPEDVLQDYVTHGDSVLLASLNLFGRRALSKRADYGLYYVLQGLSEFNIHNTLPRLQNEFCALWNELVLEIRRDVASNRGYDGPLAALRAFRSLYIALHQGTGAAPTAFSDSTPYFSDILMKPSSYPLCNIPSHFPDSTHHVHELSTAEPAHPPSTALTIHPYGDSVLVTATLSSLLVSHPDNTTPHSPHEPSLVIESSPKTPRMSPPNRAAPFDPVATAPTKVAADHPAISCTLTGTSDSPSILAVATGISQLTITPTPGGNIALQHTGGEDPLPLHPSVLPGLSFRSSPPSPPSNTFPIELQSFPASPFPPNQMPPSHELPNSETLGELGDPHSLNDPTPMGTPRYPH